MPVREIMNYEPDAILLSNGPGDPQQAVNGISVVKELAGQLPIFGICLGHQIISLAIGAETYKMKFGHRGANQPVKDLKKGIVIILLRRTMVMLLMKTALIKKRYRSPSSTRTTRQSKGLSTGILK